MNVEQVLNKKEVPFIPKGKDFIVRCLNPEHDDSNPSMRIDQITGIFNCFSCGYKGNIFSLYGEAVNGLSLKRELLKRKIQDKAVETVGLSIPRSAVPYVGNWRNIRPETYTHFEAFQSHEEDYIGRLVFPIRDISGRIRAFCGRHTTGGTPKYYFTPRKAKLPIFPSPQPYEGTIILVEGIFDAINLYDKGITNASCIFGTNNFQPEKAALLKIQGVDTVIVMMDGDEAGQKAAENIKKICEEADLKVKNLKLGNDLDPGALSQKQVDKLKVTLYK
jgi:DNA primase